MLNLFRIVVAMSIAGLSAGGFAASFDCSKASTRAELEICTDETLSELDTHLATYLKKVISSSSQDDAAKLRQSQRQWLTEIRNRCQDNECIKLAYESRLDELRISGVKDDDYNPEDDCRPPEMPSGGANCAQYVASKKRELVETELLRTYEKVISALPNTRELADEKQLPQKIAFVDFFKSWDRFRKDYCQIYGDLAGGAHVWKSANAAECEVNSAAAQTRLLTTLLKCIDGKETCMFPSQFGYGF